MSWAQTCFDKIDLLLNNTQTTIPKHWIAGLIYVECSSLDPKASRFEPHVYESVKYVKNGGKSTAFPGFNSGRLYNYISETKDETKLKALASSWGLGQLMGYHYISKWGILPESFMNLTLETSLRTTLLFMEIGYSYVKLDGTYSNAEYERLLRWHNTGSATGKTYNSDYVSAAMKQAQNYKIILEAKKPNEQLVDLQEKLNKLEDRIEKLEKIING